MNVRYQPVRSCRTCSLLWPSFASVAQSAPLVEMKKILRELMRRLSMYDRATLNLADARGRRAGLAGKGELPTSTDLKVGIAHATRTYSYYCTEQSDIHMLIMMLALPFVACCSRSMVNSRCSGATHHAKKHSCFG